MGYAEVLFTPSIPPPRNIKEIRGVRQCAGSADSAS